MLTQDELERRRHFLTATDVAPLFAKSPWSNAADVWNEKVHGRRAIGNNDAMEWGNRLEATVLEKASEKLGVILPGDWLVHSNGINACSLDGQTADREPVEAKTSGIIGPGTPHQWGEPMTDEIPEYYLLQVHAQLLVSGAKRGWVAALIGGRGFVLYCVHFDQRIADAIQCKCEKFWADNVLKKVPPGDSTPSMDTIRRLRREPNKSVELSDGVVSAWLEAKERAKFADQDLELAEREMLGALGDAEVGETSFGNLTYFEQTVKAHVRKESTFRVPRFKVDKQASAVDPKISAAIQQAEEVLTNLGYLLRNTSKSGSRSRYYCALGKPDVRLSDHEPNGPTRDWIDRTGVIDIRLNRDTLAEELSAVTQRLGEKVLP